jgi:hypothetical protein
MSAVASPLRTPVVARACRWRVWARNSTLALVVGAPVRADRAVVDTTEFSEEVAQTLAAINSKEASGPQALLDELTAEDQRQDPPEPATP